MLDLLINMMYRSLYVLLLSVSAGAGEKTCSLKEKLPVSDGSRLVGAIFDTLLTTGVAMCAKECLGRTACRAYNFHLDDGICELSRASDESSDGVSMKAEARYIFSKAQDWPKRILGTCENHNCSFNTRCVQKRDGLECVTSYCLDPPTVEFATPVSVGPLTPLAQSLPYECAVGYVPCGHVTCNADGTWSTMTCMRFPDSTDYHPWFFSTIPSILW
ncbi:uncharacterized protein LOC125374688 [Haliotis rufescens]|uniref:uncharacterized protein LOC125374688 n=1 Tax=Haliotis rufescens TaxID=6454 RepID=UPI00201F16C6|nr:uncharacterized protein LOC125374688 [Haliotis rufescens]